MTARGAGIHIAIAPETLARVAAVRPNDMLSVHYVLGFEGGGGVIAKLNVSLDDPHGMFEGSTIMQVLAVLQAQLVAQRLTTPPSFDPSKPPFIGG